MNMYLSFYTFYLGRFLISDNNVEILTMLFKNGAKIDADVDYMLLCAFGRRRFL